MRKMKIPETISIIGGTGKIGQMFSAAFSSRGYKVLIAGRNTDIGIEEAASKGDIVIISVPIRNTMEVIKRIGKLLKKDAMLTDFTSVKEMPCSCMKECFSGEVVGGHPVFGPSVEFKGQNYVLCEVRKTKDGYFEWFSEFLKNLGLNVIIMNQKEHDKVMGVVQGLNHFSNLVLARALDKSGFDLNEGDKLASPAYLLRIYSVGRLLSADENLYIDIETENPYSKEFVSYFLEASNEIYQAIEKNDKDALEKIFKESKEYFSGLIDKSMKITDRLLKGLKDEK